MSSITGYTKEKIDSLLATQGAGKQNVSTLDADVAAKLADPTSATRAAGNATYAPVANPTFTGTVGGVTKAMVGLGNVDNTADTAKPVSTAQATAIGAKLDTATAASTYALKPDNGARAVGKGELYLNVKDYGAKGDWKSVTTGAITTGTATLVATGAGFTSADVGKSVMVAGAGASGAVLSATISAYTSSTQVTLSANASTTVSAAFVGWATDDTSAISSGLDAANSANTPLFFPQSDYLSNTISKTYAPKIIGAPGARIVRTANLYGSLWTFSGAMTGSTVSLTADAPRASNEIAVPTSGFAAGDTILIADNTVVGTVAPALQGQMTRVYSIDSSSQLSLDDATYTAFTVAQTAFIQKVATIDNVSIKGLKFFNADATAIGGFLQVSYARNVDIDVNGDGSGGAGVFLTYCYDFRVRHQAENYYDNAITGLQQFGYGVAVFAASSHGKVDVLARKVRHAFTTGGLGPTSYGEPTDVQVTGVAHACTAQAWDSHSMGADISFNDCDTFGGSSYGFGVRAKRVTINGGRVVGAAGGVWLFEAASDTTVKNLTVVKIPNDTNRQTSGSNSGRAIYVGTSGFSGLLVEGCDFSDIPFSAIEFPNAMTDIEIRNNRFQNVGQAQVVGQKSAIVVGGTLSRVHIRANTCIDPQATKTTLNFLTVNTTPSNMYVVNNEVQSNIALVSGVFSGVTFGQNYTGASAGYRRDATYSSSMSLNAERQETISIALTGNLTITTLGFPADGQLCRLVFKQDATGSRTVTMPSNVKLAGTFTTSGANKVDVLTLMYDGVAALWYEMGRSLNIG